MSRIIGLFMTIKMMFLTLICLRKFFFHIKKIVIFDAKILLKFSYPIIQNSLRSDLDGYQYYDVNICADLNKNGDFKKRYAF